MALPALTVTQFLVMTALAKEPSHGYTLQTQILGDSAGIYLKAPTIYKTLKLLQARNWIETTDSETSEGPARTTYRLTPARRRILRGEAHMFDDLSGLALKRTN